MNPSENDRPLMIAVERIVRPVRASQRRKYRMREELLGHLQQLVEREGTPDRAVACFGDAAQIRQQLQASVPALERVVFQRVDNPRPLLRLYQRRPQDTDLRYMARVLVHNCITAAISLATVALLILIVPPSKHADLTIGLVFVAVIFGLIQLYSAVGILIGSPLARAVAAAEFVHAARLGLLAVVANILAMALMLVVLAAFASTVAEGLWIVAQASPWIVATALFLMPVYTALAYLTKRESDRRPWTDLPIAA